MKQIKKRHYVFVLGFIFLWTFIWPSILGAAVPPLINFQGYLTDTDGNPLDGDYSIKFSIYNVSTGGSERWNETQVVNVTDGIYSVQLGVSNSFPSDLFDGNLFLGVKVGTDLEMTPRLPVTSVAFAMKADDADTLDGLDATAFLSSGEGLADVDHNNLLVQGLGSFETAGDEGILYLGDTNSYIKSVHSSGLRLGSWLTGDALAIQQVTGNVGIGTVNPTYGKLHVYTTTGNNAIYGVNNANWGALGTTDAGAEGHHDNGHFGVLGAELYGAKGEHINGNYGILGWSWGVYGYNSTSSTIGALAGVEGAMGKHNSSGNYGQLGRSDYGAYGKHNSSDHWGALGVVGTGVEGRSTSTNVWHTAIYGRNEGAGSGVYGWSQSRHGLVGIANSAYAAIWAKNNSTGPAILAEGGSEGLAGDFRGTVRTGILEITGGSDLSEQFDIRKTIEGLLPQKVTLEFIQRLPLQVWS